MCHLYKQDRWRTVTSISPEFLVISSSGAPFQYRQGTAKKNKSKNGRNRYIVHLSGKIQVLIPRPYENRFVWSIFVIQEPLHDDPAKDTAEGSLDFPGVLHVFHGVFA